MPQYPESETALFANDTLIYATNITNSDAVNKVKKQLDTSQPWKWKPYNGNLQLIPQRQTSIAFSNKSTFYILKVTLNDTQLQWSNSIKYLGIRIDKILTFSNHIKALG